MQQINTDTDIEQTNTLKSHVPSILSKLSIKQCVQHYVYAMIYTREIEAKANGDNGRWIVEAVGTFVATDGTFKRNGYVIEIKNDPETNEMTEVFISYPRLSNRSPNQMEIGNLRWDVYDLKNRLDKLNNFYNGFRFIEFWKPYLPGDSYNHRIPIRISKIIPINETINWVHKIFSSFLFEIIELDETNLVQIVENHFVFGIKIPDEYTFTKTNTIVDCTVVYFDNNGLEIFTIVINWLECNTHINFNDKIIKKHRERVSKCPEHFRKLLISNLCILNRIKTMIETPVVPENPVVSETNPVV